MKKNFTVSKLSQLLQCEGQVKFQLKQLEKFIFENKEITIFNLTNSNWKAFTKSFAAAIH